MKVIKRIENSKKKSLNIECKEMQKNIKAIKCMQTSESRSRKFLLYNSLIYIKFADTIQANQHLFFFFIYDTCDSQLWYSKKGPKSSVLEGIPV